MTPPSTIGSTEHSAARRYMLPPGACDCHSHIFGPSGVFPFAHQPAYEPPLSTPAVHRAMLDRVGTARAVIVQPTPYGEDPRVILDALGHDRARLRGIVAAGADIDDLRLDSWGGGGVRGLRFVAAKSVSGAPMPGAVGIDQMLELGPRLVERGWHAELWSSLDQTLEAWPAIERRQLPLVLDHMGGFALDRGLADPAFRRLLALVREGAVWVKLVLCRRVAMGASLDVLRPFHDALIEANPDQLVWGSDWPFVRMGAYAPDAGGLADLFMEWVGDAALIERILVHNPIRCYNFGAIA